MFIIGEIREFATGCMMSVAVDGFTPGSYQAKMQTEQRVWDGERWVSIFETSPRLSEYYDSQYKLRA